MRTEIVPEIVVTSPQELESRGPCWSLMVGVFEGSNGPDIPESVARRIAPLCNVTLDELIESETISGFFKEYTLIHTTFDKPFRRLIIMGLGTRDRFDADALRSISARAARTVRKIRCPEMAFFPEDFEGLEPSTAANCIIEGIILGTFRVHIYRKEEIKKPELERVIVLHDSKNSGDSHDREMLQQAVDRAKAISTAANATKDVVNEPADRMNPVNLVKYAAKVGKKYGFEVEILDLTRLEEEEFGGILAVGKGSENPPCMGVLRYNNRNGDCPTIALVGKGITFDSGGISLKNSLDLHEMKYDKAGAAAVIGIFRAVAHMKLPIRMLGVIPCAENLPGGGAYRPGDVIKMWNGTQVEIISTDAEGRLILADALAYACSFKPDLVIDLATLTGGCVVALGHIATGLMSNNERLAKDLERAGTFCTERLWRLPLFREYAVQLKSIVADMMNSGGREASPVTAGLFLRHFVDRPWAHLDIAGTAWIEESTLQYYHRPYLPKRGATGVGVRLIATYLLQLLESTGGSRRKIRRRLAHAESLLDDPIGTLTMPQGGW